LPKGEPVIWLVTAMCFNVYDEGDLVLTPKRVLFIRNSADGDVISLPYKTVKTVEKRRAAMGTALVLLTLDNGDEFGFATGRKAVKLIRKNVKNARAARRTDPYAVPDLVDPNKGSDPVGQRSGYLCRGWIETVLAEIHEGVFDAGNEPHPPPSLTFIPTPPGAGHVWSIDWKDINWVDLEERESFPDGPIQAHREMFDQSKDARFLIGYLNGPGGPNMDLFAMVPVGDVSAEAMLERLRSAGVPDAKHPRRSESSSD
jgi:hypothetical protein